MSTPSIESLQKDIEKANTRIRELEEKIDRIVKNTNTAINGHTDILIRLIGHTNCPPPLGAEFTFVRNFDVGP